MNKICSKCHEEKPIEEFHKNKNVEDGYSYYCKKCKLLSDKKYRDSHKKEYRKIQANSYKKNKPKRQIWSKKYYQANKEEILKKRKRDLKENKIIINKKKAEYRKKNRLKIRKIDNDYYKNNKDKKLLSIKKCYIKHKEKRLKYLNNYYKKNKDNLLLQASKYRIKNRKQINKRIKNKKKNNPNFKIACNLRTRINNVLYGNLKSKKTLQLLDCSIPFLRQYLESLFTPEMTWENYGTYWHIDHILPCAEFDLRHSEEQEICFAWWNLQPLEKIENLKKGKKVA